MSDEEAEGIIDAVDKNGDGHISYDGNLIELFFKCQRETVEIIILHFCVHYILES